MPVERKRVSDLENVPNSVVGYNKAGGEGATSDTTNSFESLGSGGRIRRKGPAERGRRRKLVRVKQLRSNGVKDVKLNSSSNNNNNSSNNKNIVKVKQLQSNEVNQVNLNNNTNNNKLSRVKQLSLNEIDKTDSLVKVKQEKVRRKLIPPTGVKFVKADANRNIVKSETTSDVGGTGKARVLRRRRPNRVKSIEQDKDREPVRVISDFDNDIKNVVLNVEREDESDYKIEQSIYGEYVPPEIPKASLRFRGNGKIVMKGSLGRGGSHASGGRGRNVIHRAQAPEARSDDNYGLGQAVTRRRGALVETRRREGQLVERVRGRTKKVIKRKKSRGRKIDYTGEKEEEEVADVKDKEDEHEEDKEGCDEKKEDKEANKEEKEGTVEETAIGAKRKIRRKTRRRKKVGNSATRKVEEREDAPLKNFARQDHASYAPNHPQRVNTFLPDCQDNSAAKKNLPSVDTFLRNNPDAQVISGPNNLFLWLTHKTL